MAVRAFAGMTSADFTSLLCSLPSELAFNDLRDAGRRHKKAERTNPCNLNAVCVKSGIKRASGCQTVELSDSDWQQQLKGKTVKAKVHMALKPRDVDLGVDSSGLTKQKQNAAYTKPHIWCQRLRLLKVLQRIWDSSRGSLEDRAEKVFTSFKGMWTSQLVPKQCFIRWKAEASENTQNLVLCSGPHAVRILNLERVAGSDPVAYRIAGNLCRDLALVGDIDDFEICLAEAALSKQNVLAWVQKTDFMSIQKYVADYSILDVTSEVLSRLCSRLQIKGHGKLGYKKRVEAFLTHMGKDAVYLQDEEHQSEEEEPADRLEGQTDDEAEEDLTRDLHRGDDDEEAAEPSAEASDMPPGETSPAEPAPRAEAVDEAGLDVAMEPGAEREAASGRKLQHVMMDRTDPLFFDRDIPSSCPRAPRSTKAILWDRLLSSRDISLQAFALKGRSHDANASVTRMDTERHREPKRMPREASLHGCGSGGRRFKITTKNGSTAAVDMTRVHPPPRDTVQARVG
eukprot:s330_g4.t1